VCDACVCVRGACTIVCLCRVCLWICVCLYACVCVQMVATPFLALEMGFQKTVVAAGIGGMCVCVCVCACA